MKKNLHKNQIFDAANAISNSGNIPTLNKVREYLGTGSKVTIHKYFRQWKQECFKNFSSLNKIVAIDNNLLEEHSFLKLELQRQLERNDSYAQELINAEKTNIELKEEILQLQSSIKQSQLELAEIKAAKKTLEQINKQIQNKLDIHSNQAIQKMQQTIDDLRLELKTLNETSINALRETSNQGHEALMQEKVANINLQTKIDSLTKELLENKKQLNEAIMSAQMQIRSLSRENEQLQKILQGHGLDESAQLKEELNLQFAKGTTSYGK